MCPRVPPPNTRTTAVEGFEGVWLAHLGEGTVVEINSSANTTVNFGETERLAKETAVQDCEVDSPTLPGPPSTPNSHSWSHGQTLGPSYFAKDHDGAERDFGVFLVPAPRDGVVNVEPCRSGQAARRIIECHRCLKYSALVQTPQLAGFRPN